MQTVSRSNKVFIVDDDAVTCSSTRALVESMGLASHLFSSAEEFLAKVQPDARNGCLVVDVRLPGMSGLALLEQLSNSSRGLCSIVLTAHADTPLIVQALRCGALTVLDKPFREQELSDNIFQALALAHQRRLLDCRLGKARQSLARLTPGECEVLDLILEGKLNQVIANRLKVSLRTIENRRQRIFAKFHSKSVAELVRRVVEVRCYDEVQIRASDSSEVA